MLRGHSLFTSDSGIVKKANRSLAKVKKKAKVFHIIQAIVVLMALLLSNIAKGSSCLYCGIVIFSCGLAGLVITGPFLRRPLGNSWDVSRVIAILCDLGFLIIGLGLIYRVKN
jgi:hypothetical protein